MLVDRHAVRVPPALVEPCPKPPRAAPVRTRDIVNRMQAAEGALDLCAARVDAVAAWDAANARAGGRD
jgi:hypothetical protein